MNFGSKKTKAVTPKAAREIEVKGRVIEVVRDPELWQVSLLIDEVDYKKEVEHNNDEIVLGHDNTNGANGVNHDARKRCILTGGWYNTNVKEEDVVFVRTGKFVCNTLQVNNSDGFVVINPDKMVTSTAISRSVFCLRSSWLSEMFKGFGLGNKEMIIGNMVHELFQFGCVHKHVLKEIYLQELDRLMQRQDTIFVCYLNHICPREVKEAVVDYVEKIISWIQDYFLSDGKAPDEKNSNTKVQVTRVLDVEDNIWTPKLGIKGKIDLTLEVKIHERNKVTCKTVPLELKTGRHVNSMEHQGQVSLYTMMLDDKKLSSDLGLLLYLKESVDMKMVACSLSVKKSLIQTRNELTHFIGKLEEMPEVKNIHRLCSKCSHVFDCTLMEKTFNEMNLDANSEVRDFLIPDQLGHLWEQDIEFFRRWMRLVYLEANSEDERDRSLKFWDESSEIREKNGTGFAKLKLTNFDPNACRYTFVRASDYQKRLGDLPHQTSLIKKLERVTLTIEDENEELVKIANVSGYVKEIDALRLEIVCSKEISSELTNKLFRVDLATSSYSSSPVSYTNLLRLMVDDPNSERLRSLIVHRVAPKFNTSLAKTDAVKMKPLLNRLNNQQRRAVFKTVCADDYSLIHGSPGAGKTETIVTLIRILIEQDKTVFITSHTHSAVDNILLKLMPYNMKILRLGSSLRIHPLILKFSESEQLENVHTAEALDQLYSSFNVVAGTCLTAISHPVFAERLFDFCIFDEASQTLLPETLGALFFAKKFVLVGDPKQLPPVVRCKEALQKGLACGLFEYLENDQNSIRLNIQYRMNSEIMRIANEFTYDNQLLCANEDVAKRTVALAQDKKRTDNRFWLFKCMNNKLEDSVVFLDTCGCADADHQKDENNFVSNYFELSIVRKITQTFAKLDLKGQQVGIITPYQKQVKLLRNAFAHDEIEVNTVDQYQGRDKEVIIFSCVRSDSQQMTSFPNEILNDERRLNVAITRAKHKLIMIGNRVTLSHYGPFKKLFQILRHDQIVALKDEIVTV